MATIQSRGVTDHPTEGRRPAGIALWNRDEDGPSALPRVAVATRIPRVVSEVVQANARVATVSRFMYYIYHIYVIGANQASKNMAIQYDDRWRQN